MAPTESQIHVKSPPPETLTVRQTFESLERRVRTLEQHARIAEPEVPAVDDATARQIITITQQLFPGEVSIEFQFDPEYPGHVYSVVCATCEGATKEVADRRERWHKRIWEAIPGDRIWRLSLSRA